MDRAGCAVGDRRAPLRSGQWDGRRVLALCFADHVVSGDNLDVTRGIPNAVAAVRSDLGGGCPRSPRFLLSGVAGPREDCGPEERGRECEGECEHRPFHDPTARLCCGHLVSITTFRSFGGATSERGGPIPPAPDPRRATRDQSPVSSRMTASRCRPPVAMCCVVSA